MKNKNLIISLALFLSLASATNAFSMQQISIIDVARNLLSTQTQQSRETMLQSLNQQLLENLNIQLPQLALQLAGGTSLSTTALNIVNQLQTLIQQEIQNRSSSSSDQSSSWTPQFIRNFWQGAKEKTHAAATSYLPGYTRMGVSIKDWSASRFLITVSAAMYGLMKIGYNYQSILDLFISVAAKIWDKATIANGLITAATAIGGSAILADTAAANEAKTAAAKKIAGQSNNNPDQTPYNNPSKESYVPVYTSTSNNPFPK